MISTPVTDEPVAPLRRRCAQDFVLCREVEEIDRRARVSEGSQLAVPTMYEILGDHSRDRMFIGEVIDTGPGVTVHGQHEGMCVTRGEVFIANLSNCSYKLTERGDKCYLYRQGIIMAVLDRETMATRPVLDMILVRANEERAVAHMSRGPIWLPTEQIATDDEGSRNRPGLKGEYGEVVDKGPGRWLDGQWQSADCQKGDLIMYDASWGTLPISIKGKPFTLVPSKNFVMVADEA